MEIILYDFRIIDSEEIGLMIQAFDDDGDGEIDYNEFLVILLILQFCLFKTKADGLPTHSSRKSHRSRYQSGEASKARSQKLLCLSILYIITCKSILLFILIT